MRLSIFCAICAAWSFALSVQAETSTTTLLFTESAC